MGKYKFVDPTTVYVKAQENYQAKIPVMIENYREKMETLTPEQIQAVGAGAAATVAFWQSAEGQHMKQRVRQLYSDIGARISAEMEALKRRLAPAAATVTAVAR